MNSMGAKLNAVSLSLTGNESADMINAAYECSVSAFQFQRRRGAALPASTAASAALPAASAASAAAKAARARAFAAATLQLHRQQQHWQRQKRAHLKFDGA